MAPQANSVATIHGKGRLLPDEQLQYSEPESNHNSPLELFANIPQSIANEWDLNIDLRFKAVQTEKFSVIEIAQSCYKIIGTDGNTSIEEKKMNLVHAVALSISCSYTRKIVEKSFIRRPWWNISSTPATAANAIDLQWSDYECIDWQSVLSGTTRANSYCIRKGLSRKAQFSVYLKRFCAKNPTSILQESTPKTIVIETWSAFEDEMTMNISGDIASFGADLKVNFSFEDRIGFCLADAYEEIDKSPDSRWILKPSVANKGAEIFLITEPHEVKQAILQWPDMREWVLQKYIERPLLVSGRKFHIRAYILAVGCLEVYFFNHCLVLASGTSYHKNFTNIYAHLTNTAKQVENEEFDEKRNVMLLSDLVSDLRDQQAVPDAEEKVSDVLRQMHQITHDIFMAFRGEFSVFAPLENCFEIFGFDFMVDDDFKVHVLEVNPGPDFKQTGTKLKKVISQLIDDTITLAVDQKLGLNSNVTRNSHENGFTKVFSEMRQNRTGGSNIRLF
mmetsp:Transcript_13004/g.17125  ORF Transcript_13004/g.17125 Transcript_13004/m.17125 type:complete len:505 (+) Transcript_13004:133-1647(+)